MSAIDGIVENAGITGFAPTFLRPLVGSLASSRTRGRLAKLQAKYDPIFQERIRGIRSEKPEASEPTDLLQKMLRYAEKNRPDELETSQMTKRLLMANLGFIYQPSFAMSNMILNIVNSDAEYGTISTLRKEATGFLGSGNDAAIWTQTNISKLVKADSVARETLRLNAVATRSIVRKVMKDGVRTDEGHELPKGTLVSFVSQPMHTDKETFENPNKFDPFRFSRIREATGDPTNEESHKFQSTAHLLIFGRGRNSCPGRFLVDFQLKMMISHLLTNYDIKFPDEYQGRRPPNQWLLEFIFPPKGVKVMVRRRKAV